MSLGTATEPTRGLDNVIALQSSICRLSAEDGTLAYRGFDVRELADRSTAEETAFLLLHGQLPSAVELRQFTGQLRALQKLSPGITRSLKALPPGSDPTAALRAALAVLALEHPAGLPPSREDAMAQALRLVAVTPTIVAAQHRLRHGQKPVLPKKSLSLAANFLAMVTGTAPGRDSERAFDAAMILRADNELNPSTFAARVTAGTGADVFSGVIAALSALSGPRHGWHTRLVIAALDEIGAPEAAAEWVRRGVVLKRKLPGFGHVVYQGEDPRTAMLRGLAEAECQRAGLWALFRTARELELAVARETGEHPIVDFYLAPLYRALGIPTDLFTAVFALSRMPGWAAHILEQLGEEKMLRPRAEYVGPVGLEYRSLRQRR